MEKKNSKGLVIVVVILLLAVLGLGGYLVYDKVLNKETKETENKAATEDLDVTSSEKTTINGSYLYDGPFDENLKAHIELRLSNDNTFILYYSTTDAVAYKGTYTLDSSKLMLYAIEADGFQSDSSRDFVSADRFECTYDHNDDTININKSYHYYNNPETKKVDNILDTGFDDKTLTKTNSLQYIDNEKLFEN